MIKFKVKFNNLQDIADFCGELDKLDFEADLSNGRYLIPAKSIMSIIGINPTDTMDLILYTDDKNMKNIFNRWRVI